MRHRVAAAAIAVLVATVGCSTRSSISTPAGGIEFNDPEGTYTMTVDKNWARGSTATAKGIETWIVAAPASGFAPNVNVLTQPATGMDLAHYMDVSLRNMGDFQVRDHRTVRGTHRTKLGRLEYSGVITSSAGKVPLRFLALIDVNNGRAVVATLSVQESAFEAQRKIVEPYLLTLNAT